MCITLITGLIDYQIEMCFDAPGNQELKKCTVRIVSPQI